MVYWGILSSCHRHMLLANRQGLFTLKAQGVIGTRTGKVASNPMPGPSQSGCVEKPPKKMGNGDRGSSVPIHTTVLDGLKAPETEFMGNPRGLFC